MRSVNNLSSTLTKFPFFRLLEYYHVEEVDDAQLKYYPTNKYLQSMLERSGRITIHEGIESVPARFYVPCESILITNRLQ